MKNEIDDVVSRLHSLGRAEWPGIELDVAAFAALAGRLQGESSDVRAGELYLAAGCAAGVEPAIAAFDRHYLTGLASALVHRGCDPAAAADAVQAVRVRFLVGETGRGPRIAAYDGRGSLATLLRVAATRIALDARRRTHRETGDEIEALSAERSPELELLHHRFGAAFDAAFRSAFQALSRRERTLLRYQVIDRLGIDRVAAIYGVHRATAARWLAHARDALVAGVRGTLAARLEIDGDELDSLLRAVRSRLELSLRLLVTPT